MIVESSPNVSISEVSSGLFIVSGNEINKPVLYSTLNLNITGDSVIMFTRSSDTYKLVLCDSFDLYSSKCMQLKLKEISYNSLVLVDLKDRGRLYIDEDGLALVSSSSKGFSILLKKN